MIKYYSLEILQFYQKTSRNDKFSSVTEYRVNLRTSIAYLCANKKPYGDKGYGLTPLHNSFKKYLGINVTNDMKDLCKGRCKTDERDKETRKEKNAHAH